jgi:hypothetical protein
VKPSRWLTFEPTIAAGDVIEGANAGRDPRRALGAGNISHRRRKIALTIVEAEFLAVDGPSLLCGERYRRLNFQPTMINGVPP